MLLVCHPGLVGGLDNGQVLNSECRAEQLTRDFGAEEQVGDELPELIGGGCLVGWRGRACAGKCIGYER